MPDTATTSPTATEPSPAVDPVLAGFARLAVPTAPPIPEPEPIDPTLSPWQTGLVRLSRQRATRPAAPIAQPEPIETPSQLPRPWNWAILLAAVLALQFCFYLIITLRSPSRSARTNPAAIAVQHYAQLCDSEIVAKLRAANDGTLTGEQALRIIETARPVIQQHTWTDLANRLTSLQDQHGLLHQADTAAFLDEMSAGLLSF